MTALPPALERLAALLSRLPSIGERSAQRLALHILKQNADFARSMADAMQELHGSVQFCEQCHHLATGALCSFCQDAHRDRRLLCVVEDVPDLLAIERSSEFHGLYHVLHGVLSPLKGVGPRDLTLDSLLQRVRRDRPDEVIVATSVSVEGEATASYVQALLGAEPVRISRIASGVPQGAELEYLDQATLGRALKARLLLGGS